ncbi:glycoside hydrolase family 16 protein [Granulosicoccus sp. 3-233]|uniref:glycoside hydrolase family 16 protein n=1 Tax=Granulosicoccus sp. 3-233 TaxID=3417969 RepID=UPI003D347856
MKNQLKMLSRSTVVCLSLLFLSACGESDLIELQERELDDAREAAQQEPDAEAANPEQGIDDPSSGRIDLTQYDLVFADDFRGSRIDPVKWNTALDWGPDLSIHDQMQYYVDVLNEPDFGHDPFTLNGEELVITASQTPENLRADANEQSWLSGVLTTAEKFDFSYGYVEARIDLPDARGAWPSFWMLSSDFIGLKPEVYIMEQDGAYPNSVFFNYNYLEEQGTRRELVSAELADGFHQYGLAWSPQELLFYVDRVPRYRIVGDAVASQKMYLILNLAMGGVWPGAPDATSGSQVSMVVDYVRAFQLKP